MVRVALQEEGRMTRDDLLQAALAFTLGYSLVCLLALTGCTIPWHIG
jgi:hypothetical protein